jgi:acetylglutamate kinase
MLKEKLYIVKIGGNIISQPQALQNCIRQIAAIKGKKIVVHGGGKLVDELAGKLGIAQQKIDGRRITSAETRDLALMVYAGLSNKKIVAQLNAKGLNALGLTGADNSSIVAERRKPIPVDYGFVGDIDASGINAEFIHSLLEEDILPVFCSITMTKEGELLNTNADTIASVLAVALSDKYDVSLVYCFEKPGVLRDINDDSSLIKNINKAEFALLKASQIVNGGMLPKLQNAFEAIEKGVTEVIITKEDKIQDAVEGIKHTGTRLIA